jgi:cephalosporin hydroxylase
MSGDGIVQIAYLHPDLVSHSWVSSMHDAWLYDAQAGADVTALDRPSGSERIGGNRLARKPLNVRTTSVSLMTARNFAVKLFLEKTSHEWLMWIDTDMGFEPDAIHCLLRAADPVNAPIVGGLCFAQYGQEYDGKGGYSFRVVPTMYRIGTTAEGMARFCFYGDYPADEVTEVAATGSAFILIHRSVLEGIKAKYGEVWYSQVIDDAGDIIGEDMIFCTRARAIGKKIFVHTGVATTHHKSVWLSEQDYIEQSVIQSFSAPSNPEALYPTLPPAIDVAQSIGTLVNNDHDHDGMLKLADDLARYEEIIKATKPDLIIETGTWNGQSARWFAARGVDVISIDVDSPVPPGTEDLHATNGGAIRFMRGDSVELAQKVAWIIAGGDIQRVMVVLDSDHSAAHVAAEIQAYAPLVTPGCYLVVEDGIFGYAPPDVVAQHFPAGLEGNPLDAIADQLVGHPGWSRDVAIERLSPASHHPAGWWVRHD